MAKKKPKQTSPTKDSTTIDDDAPRKMFLDCPWNEVVTKIGWHEADCLLILLECLTFVPGNLGDMLHIEDRWDLVRARAIRMSGFPGYEEDYLSYEEVEAAVNRDPKKDMH